MAPQWLLVWVMASFLHGNAMPITFSARLIHRFSEEMKALQVSSVGGRNVAGGWPEKRSMEYYEMLVTGDFLRHKMKLRAPHQLLFPSHGSKTMSLGNDFGWLHYTWIDIGTPSTSFLVALDAGSDLLWVPCDCIQCAPLSASNYANLDKDLNEYSPSRSTSSKNLSCSHQLCEMGSDCKSSRQLCPYTVNYVSENTSSSGLLVEDILHLASSGDGESNSTVQASVIIGCGMKQSGGYLDGVAPDGLMGLGTGEISVPSLLAKSGLIHNSFSMCFDDDDSGRIFFGDQGSAIQQSTPFLPLDGIYPTYVIGVEACCVKDSYLKMTSFKAQVDSGTSFTFLPGHVYDAITEEFDHQVNASRSTFEGSPWDYCYASSSPELPKVPSLTFTFQQNSSFVIHNPVFVFYDDQGVIGFCLAIQPTDGDMGTIGQNFMTGYRLVFDRENMKLSWSQSSCEDLAGKNMPPSPNKTPPKPLPTNEQQRTNGHAVAPAVAGRAPHKPSTASSLMMSCQRQHWHICLFLLLQLVVASSRL
ncbi:aspartic proteinase-like protein 1 isoform X1 [Neltuma alba]|uniref:aspartic proteinase-like protein 1 n=1 Tax=Neltuma alba TaxID=207710 RepID=UPI0010A2C2EA|nr:aspartic proteinase-like protein 1 [Prosopis alba]XP_028763466.1 aspartic proteinase-like protein 1 isoform X1 [Prosopis alba]